MESKIFNCVDHDDVEALKLLMDYPNIFQIEGRRGYTILQRAIYQHNFEVFDFLLSLDGCPINAPNKKGKTALEVAMMNRNHHEYFAYSLLKKGAYIDYNHKHPSLLYSALNRDYIKVAKLLIEKGADLNCYDDIGRTPLHCIFNRLDNDSNELLAMMLCFGADPSLPDDQGCSLIDKVCGCYNGGLSESLVEHLLFYCFDEYSTGYDISLYSLFWLLWLDPPFAPQILKHITSVNLDKYEGFKYLQVYFIHLLTIEPKYLKLLLEKFDSVIQNIIDAFLECGYFHKDANSKEMFIENFDLLFQSRFSSDVIQIISKIPVSTLIGHTEFTNKPRSDLINLILFLLSYGTEINDFDLELIYRRFGDCEFFRMLLHMDIKINEFRRYENDIMPGILYNFRMDLETFLSEPDRCDWSSESLRRLLNYFAHTKLQNFCYSIGNEDVYAKVKDLPSVPLLVELARNKVRKFLIQKYKIKNSMQFYTLIKHLPISKVHQKIITLETKLY